MKTLRASLFLFACAGLLLGLGYGWFAFGVFSDREFGGLYLFRKHCLSSRFYFYAPLGESDTPLSALPRSQQDAEAAFHDFVEVHGGYERKWCLRP